MPAIQNLRPKAWANRLTTILDVGDVASRFPVDVPALASWFSANNNASQDEPIIGVTGGDLGKIDGCLMPTPDVKGWAILYNDTVRSAGRVRHTQAHEFGHYLLHRDIARRSNGLRCAARDIAAGPASRQLIEREADEFASTLLMPFNDLRQQIRSDQAPDLDSLSMLATRYGTSLTATALRWLEMTNKSAVVVAADENFLLWARSSDTALKSGCWLKATSGAPLEAPPGSLLAAGMEDRLGHCHELGVWFDRPSVELCLVPDNYDFRLSIVILPDVQRDEMLEEDDPVAVPVDVRFRNR